MGPRQGTAAEESLAMLRIRELLVWLQWGRDEGVAEEFGPLLWRPIAPLALNGAATRVSRKRSPGTAISTSRTSLQWGRDEGVAEEALMEMPEERGYVHRYNGAATRVSRKSRTGWFRARIPV